MGFLFGSERFGMANEDVYRCNVALSIPTNPKFGSLNLGAAIQLIAYEWRMALGGFADVETENTVRPEPVEGLKAPHSLSPERLEVSRRRSSHRYAATLGEIPR